MFRLQLAAVICCSLQLASAAPQFVTFKDGKVGVNFGGYHAEAGLGGLLTGNAAHGGLSASAGTPWGPQAAAGLNGALNGGRGRAAGSAYAGAQLNSNVGASSVIGGEVGGEQQGFAGAEAHSAAKTVMKTRDVVAGGGVEGAGEGGAGEGGAEGWPHDAAPEFNVQTVKTSSVQKIKPHKKYNLLKGEQQHEVAHSKQLIKPAYKEVRLPSGSTVVTHDNSFVHSQQHQQQQQQQQQHLHQSASPGFETASVGVHANTGLVGNLLNIPIGILKSLQESLSGVDVNKSLSYTKLS